MPKKNKTLKNLKGALRNGKIQVIKNKHTKTTKRP